MADAIESKRIVVLWDEEVRQAAKLLRAWHDCEDDKQRDQLAVEAFNACLVALWGIQEDSPLVMLGSSAIKRIMKGQPRLELEAIAE
jgi:hypothetical protein